MPVTAITLRTILLNDLSNSTEWLGSTFVVSSLVALITNAILITVIIIALYFAVLVATTMNGLDTCTVELKETILACAFGPTTRDTVVAVLAMLAVLLSMTIRADLLRLLIFFALFRAFHRGHTDMIDSYEITLTEASPFTALAAGGAVIGTTLVTSSATVEEFLIDRAIFHAALRFGNTSV